MPESRTRTRWLIVALTFCVGMVMFVDRVNIAIAAKHIMPEFGFSDVQMGWIFSAYVLGYALFQVPGGWLGDHWGSRRVLAVAIFAWSFFTALTAVAGELFFTSVLGVMGSFIVVRMLVGVGEAGGWPNYNRVVATWVAPQEQALALGIITSGVGLGAIVTPPLFAWLMVGVGWRTAFFLAGGIGILLALVWYRFVTDQPAAHPWVNDAELQHITQAPALAPQQRRTGPTPWRAILRCPDLWFLTASYLMVGYVIYLYYSWFYLYVVNVLGFSVLSGGLYAAAPYVASTAASPLGGWLSDRLSQRFGKRIGRCGIGLGSMVLSAGFIFVGAAATDPYRAILLLSLGSGALALGTAAYWVTIIDLASASAHVGTLTGFMTMGASLGGAVSPVLTPLLAQHFGWESGFYMAAGVSLVGGLLWLGVHPERSMELKAVAYTLPPQKEIVLE